MPQFDRFDICAAHRAIEIHYHEGGWLRERPSNRRRMESTDVQLRRMGYVEPSHWLDCFEALTENGRAIYRELERRYGFKGPAKPKPEPPAWIRHLRAFHEPAKAPQMNDTTRTYPRSAVLAFPRTVEYAIATERYRANRGRLRWALAWTLVYAVCLGLAVVCRR